MAEDFGPSAGKVRVKITCPLALVVDMEVDSILIPATRGNFLIMPRKAPAFYVIKEGQVILHRADKPDKVYWVSRGVCEVRRDICAIMAWAAEKTSVRPDDLRAELERGEAVRATLPAGKASESLQNRLDFYRYVLENLKH